MALDPEILAQFKAMGPCLSVGSEVWFITSRKLNVGKVSSKIIPGESVEVETASGKRVLNPEDVLLFATPKKGMGKRKGK